MNKMIAELKALSPQERFKTICGIINQEQDDNVLRSKLTAIFDTFEFALTHSLYEECHGDKKKLIELIIKKRKMERFKYKEWIKNPQRKIITRNGEKAVIVGVGYNDNSVIAKIGNQEQKYTENGFFLGESENAEDLFFADDNIVEVGHQEEKIYWRKCKAGYKFPSDAIVIADDERTTDRDPRLVRCAVWDSKYILVEDLKKLPIEK